MSDISERVKKIVVEHLGVEPDKVTEQASFIDDLGADSLDTVELVMAFEEEFGCEIPDDAAETILTVGRRGEIPRKERQELNRQELNRTATDCGSHCVSSSALRRTPWSRRLATAGRLIATFDRQCSGAGS